MTIDAAGGIAAKAANTPGAAENPSTLSSSGTSLLVCGSASGPVPIATIVTAQTSHAPSETITPVTNPATPVRPNPMAPTPPAVQTATTTTTDCMADRRSASMFSYAPASSTSAPSNRMKNTGTIDYAAGRVPVSTRGIRRMQGPGCVIIRDGRILSRRPHRRALSGHGGTPVAQHRIT